MHHVAGALYGLSPASAGNAPSITRRIAAEAAFTRNMETSGKVSNLRRMIHQGGQSWKATESVRTTFNEKVMIERKLNLSFREATSGSRAQGQHAVLHLVAAQVFVVQAFQPLLQFFVGYFFGGGGGYFAGFE